MATHPVNTQWNIVVAMSPWFHDILIPPAPPVPGPALDLPCPQMWAGAAISGKFTTTVMHNMQFICLDGHNVGMLIPHITMPMSPMLAIIIPFSERKLMFSASTVKMNDKPAGVAALLPIPTPMMDCGDPVGNPLTVYPMNFCNTLHVGLTFMDVLFGVMGVLIDVAVDLAFEGIFKSGGASALWGKLARPHRALLKGGKEAAARAISRMGKKAIREGASEAVESTGKFLAKKTVDKFIPFVKKDNALKWAIKTGLNNAKDNTRAAVDPATDEQYGFNAGIGHGNFAEVKGEATYNTTDDVSTAKGSGSALGAEGEAEANYGGEDAAPEDQGFGHRRQGQLPWSDKPSTYDSRAPQQDAPPKSAGNTPGAASNPPPENLTPQATRV